VIRRIDTDGDAKIALAEFAEGVRSQFAQVQAHKYSGGGGGGVQQPKPTAAFFASVKNTGGSSAGGERHTSSSRNLLKQQTHASHSQANNQHKKSRSNLNTP
jgi:hypothetical protein